MFVLPVVEVSVAEYHLQHGDVAIAHVVYVHWVIINVEVHFVLFQMFVLVLCHAFKVSFGYWSIILEAAQYVCVHVRFDADVAQATHHFGFLGDGCSGQHPDTVRGIDQKKGLKEAGVGANGIMKVNSHSRHVAGVGSQLGRADCTVARQANDLCARFHTALHRLQGRVADIGTMHKDLVLWKLALLSVANDSVAMR